VNPLATMALSLSILDTWDDPAVIEAWQNLLPRARYGWFLTPEWCRLIVDAFHPRAARRVIIVNRGNVTLGILPESRRRMNRFGLFLPITEAFVGARADYTLPLLAEDADPAVLEMLIGGAIKECASGSWTLAHIPSDGGVPEAVETILRKSGRVYQRRSAACVQMRFGDSGAPIENSLSKSLRGDLRRQRRRIEEKLGPLQLRVIQDKAEALATLPLLFDMHDKRWHSAGTRGSFSDLPTRRYYSLLVERLWDRGLHFSVLRAGDRVVAYHLGMIHDNWLLYYKPTHDADLANFSPGKLLLWLLAQDATQSGLAGIDFLQGDEAYKGEWATTSTETVSFTVRTSRTSLSYSWITRGRPFAERLVGRMYDRAATAAQTYFRRKTSASR
jgi:CelD/BcsL family acetyltransferase involved in cellulose biosynthesis